MERSRQRGCLDAVKDKRHVARNLKRKEVGS